MNVLQYHQQLLVNLMHAQMQAHFVESATEYEVNVTKGFIPCDRTTIRPTSMTPAVIPERRSRTARNTDWYHALRRVSEVPFILSRSSIPTQSDVSQSS